MDETKYQYCRPFFHKKNKGMTNYSPDKMNEDLNTKILSVIAFYDEYFRKDKVYDSLATNNIIRTCFIKPNILEVPKSI
jgi:hypothetical protein